MLTPKWNEEIKSNIEKHVIDGRDSNLTLEDLAVPWMEWTIAMYAEIHSLQQQNKQLIEALVKIIHEHDQGSGLDIQVMRRMVRIANEALQGGTSNGTSNHNA